MSPRGHYLAKGRRKTGRIVAQCILTRAQPAEQCHAINSHAFATILPQEVWIYIMGFLCLDDVLSCAPVSRRFRSLSYSGRKVLCLAVPEVPLVQLVDRLRSEGICSHLHTLSLVIDDMDRNVLNPLSALENLRSVHCQFIWVHIGVAA